MTSPHRLAELRGVTVSYGAGEHDAPVLRDVDLALDEGELLLVSGRTGAGKSTLLGLLTGLVPRSTGGRVRGSVHVAGVDVLRTPARERAHLVGHVAQDPVRGFVTDVVEEELAFGMEQLALPPATMRRRVEEVLDLLGIADLRDRDLRTLSGGQQQRVALGAVLTTHPRLLVLDEPTSALDPGAAEEVLATLTRLVHDLGLTVVVAEHRLERVVPFADRMCLLDGSGAVLVGEPVDLLETSPVVPPIVDLGRWAGWRPLPLSVREARRRAADLRARLDGLPEHAPVDPVVGAAAEPPLLAATGLSVLHGPVVALREVDLALPAGRVLAVMGRNGAGKSSLLWALQGSGPRAAGTVLVAGEDPAALAPEQRRAAVGLVPQQAADLLYLGTVGAECRAADAAAGAAPGSCRALLDRLVAGVPDDQHPRDLSEGQRLALVLAVVLTAEPAVLLLDEPTRGLDYPAKAALAQALRALTADGRAVVVSTHDVEFVAAAADDVAVLAEGEVVSRGPVRRVVAESPSYAPQVAKILGPRWLRVAEVAAALPDGRPGEATEVPA